MPRDFRTTAAIGLAATCAATSLLAGTIRHDVPYQTYVDYGDSMRLVGGLGVSDSMGLPSSYGSGVLITPQWVLTAAHVVYDATIPGTTISFETDPDPNEVVDPKFPYPLSGIFYADYVAIHEFYIDGPDSPYDGFDIALVHLDMPVPQYSPYQRFRGNPATNPEIGRVGTSVGFGMTGTGITGFDGRTGLSDRLAGDNMIDGLASDPRLVNYFRERTVVDPSTGQTIHFTKEQIAGQFLISDFDDPATDELWTNDGLNPLGSADPLAMEYEVAPGDSGGPLMTLVNGEWQVMGINSWIWGLAAPDGDGTDNASYGDLSGYLRVTEFNDWIDRVINVPEPSAIAISIFVVSTMLLKRGRRQSPHNPASATS